MEDEHNRFTFWLYLQDIGMASDKAAKEVFKRHPKWGDPNSENGEDRPLYIEMKFRVLEFIERLQSNPEEMEQRLENCSSLNALFRHEMRNGRA